MTTTTSATSSSASTTAASTTTSASSVGQSILTSLNANGTGIDTSALITNLTAAEKSSLEAPLIARQTANTAQISSLATLTNDLSTFSSQLNVLIQGGTLLTQPTSSDTSVATVSALANSSIGDLSGTVTVTTIAQGQTLESQPVTGNTPYASGALTITTTGGKSITLNAGVAGATGTDFSDLPTLVTAINGKTATTGVTASIVTDGDGSHLVLKGATGAAQGFSVTGTGDVSGFGYTPVNGDTATVDTKTGSGMQRVQVAQDAAFSIDGVAYTRSSNTVSDAINGVKITLVKAGTISLSSARPTAAITSAVGAFVDAYNQMISDIGTATAAATSTTDAGALRGNNTIRNLQSQLSKLTTTPLNASGKIRSLAELGVQTQQDGTLSLNSTKLASMLSNYPDDVEAMFTTSQSSTDPNILISSTAGTAASGVYALTNVSASAGTITQDGIAMTSASGSFAPGKGSTATGLSLQLLAGAGSSATISINQGLGGALQAISDGLLGTNGALALLKTNLTSTSSSLVDALTKVDAQVTVYHDQLVTKFTQMNTLVSGYKATQSYLTQQVALWTKSTN